MPIQYSLFGPMGMGIDEHYIDIGLKTDKRHPAKSPVEGSLHKTQ